MCVCGVCVCVCVYVCMCGVCVCVCVCVVCVYVCVCMCGVCVCVYVCMCHSHFNSYGTQQPLNLGMSGVSPASSPFLTDLASKQDLRLRSRTCPTPLQGKETRRRRRRMCVCVVCHFSKKTRFSYTYRVTEMSNGNHLH